jgi:Tat protein translocase TatC
MAVIDPDEYRMSLGDHLEELRYRLLLGLIGPVVFMFLLLLVADDLIGFLVLPMLWAQETLGLPKGFINTTSAGPFNLYFKLTLIGGLVMGIPWLFWQLWKFIEPGLHRHERRIIHMIIPGSAALAAAGCVFLYYVLLPVTLLFLLKFATDFQMPTETQGNPLWQWMARIVQTAPAEVPPPSPDPTNNSAATPNGQFSGLQLPVLKDDPPKPREGDAWVKLPEHQMRVWLHGRVWHSPLTTARLLQQYLTLDDYIDMVMWLALAFAVSFQLPMVMLVLSWVGIIEYAMLKGLRKYAVLASVVVAAILTPGSDPFSLAALSMPLYGLYELGLLLVRLVEARRAGKERQEAAAGGS